jgi:hypothetical protein
MPSLLTYLKDLAARFRASETRFPPIDFPPLDDGPDSRVRQPRTPSPGGRHSSVALAEPQRIEPVEARGSTRSRT